MVAISTNRARMAMSAPRPSEVEIEFGVQVPAKGRPFPL
jgi:hypothetical protein